MDIIVQLIGGLGILASIVSFQCKKHSSIIFFRTLNEFIFAIQYFLLGAYTGTAVSIIGCIRNIIFTKRVSNNKKTTVPVIIFSILFIIFGIATWQGKKSILIIVAKVLSTMAYGNKNTTVVRGVILVTSVSWLIYNSVVFSIAGVLCEAFTIISLIAGIVRLDVVPYFKQKKSSVKDA